tara:strand:- start:211101 stop:211469 length:369 start_codon:yes stop_codon:yes gene_type:complete
MTTIDLAVLQPLVSEMLLAVLTAFASYAVAKICQWLKAKRDGELGQILDKALAMGIAFAMSRLDALGKDRLTIDVKSELAADAANYVLVHVPDAVKALGLDGEHLRRMIEARLQVNSAGNAA